MYQKCKITKVLDKFLHTRNFSFGVFVKNVDYSSGFLGVGKNFRLLMQSCCFFCFFSSRVFHETFKFLKNCPYDFHKILDSHSTPKGAPGCAKASKSYGWDVRNIAKISPKLAKKQPLYYCILEFILKSPVSGIVPKNVKRGTL